MTPGLGVARVSTLVPLNVMVTLDAALAKKMVDFIIQPCDHQERGGKQLTTILTVLFPQLLSMSSPPFSLSLISFIDSIDILLSVTAGSHRCPTDIGFLPGACLVGEQPSQAYGGHEGGGLGPVRMGT